MWRPIVTSTTSRANASANANSNANANANVNANIDANANANTHVNADKSLLLLLFCMLCVEQDHGWENVTSLSATSWYVVEQILHVELFLDDYDADNITDAQW